MDFNELKEQDGESSQVEKPAKKQKNKQVLFKKITPQQQIKSCQNGCNGEPPIFDFSVKNFKGKACEKCYLIISYERDSTANNNT